MSSKKYEFTDEVKETLDGLTLHRIKALRDIGDLIKTGDLGGFLQYKKNLLQSGDAWVFGNAWVYENALVSGVLS